MKQIVMDGPRRSRIVDVPEPAISGAQLLVRVTLTGMCHSEWYPWNTAKKGDILGHEAVGGYHNDGPRTLDWKLWNFKAMTVVNCHERRIDYEATLCPRCLDLIARGYWKFRGVTRVYGMEDFDRANEDMESHRDNFIKGAVRIA